ncbi:hypothetical protein ACHQM5_027746 [Ranunculus cassubicifolius]
MAVAESSSKLACFECGEKGHIRNDCPWVLGIMCLECERNNLKLWMCKRGENKGQRFVRCGGQPECSYFRWLKVWKEEELKATSSKKMVEEKITELKDSSSKKMVEETITENANRNIVKLTLDGHVKMTIEGNVNDVCKMVNDLGILD